MRSHRPLRLRLDELESRNLLASIYAIGEADGTVRIVNAADNTELVTDFFPLDTATSEYVGLVQVALGDLNQDGTDDVFVSAANPSGAAGLDASKAGKVFVFDGATLAAGTIPASPFRTFTPFATTDGPAGSTAAYTNGLNIAAADVNGDGTVDLIAGSRGGNGTATGGRREVGRLVAISGASTSNVVLGSIVKPFGSGYEKGVVVAAGNADGLGGAEIAVTRGGPVASTNPAVQQIKVKVLKLNGGALSELPMNADGSTAFAPFATLSGPANAIKRDGRVAFVDQAGDGKAELVFSALDPLTNASNGQVRVAVYSINTTATAGAATIASKGPDAGTYTTGTAVTDHAISQAATAGFAQNLALFTQSATSGIAILSPLTGAVLTGGGPRAVITGGITIATGKTGGGSSGDAEAPSIPGTPTPSNLTGTSVGLTWAASTDNVGVTGYTVLGREGASGSFTTFATSSPPAVTLTGLTAGTLYNFVVTARDAAGNTSGQSGVVTVTTPGAGADDGFEANDTRQTAADLGTPAAPLTENGLVLLNDDWFSFTTTTAGLDGSVRIDFSDALGDLDMELYNSAGEAVGFSGGTGDSESIPLGGLPAGTYSVFVYGYDGATNPGYSLTVTPPTVAPPTDDGFEDNDDRASAASLGTLTQVENINDLALLDDDWFEFTTAGVGRNDSLVAIYFQAGLGDLDMKLYDGGGTLLDTSGGTTGSETISLTDRPAGTYYIQVFGFGGDTNPAYSMTIQTPTADDVYEENDTQIGAFDFGMLINELTVDNLALNDDDFFTFTTDAAGLNTNFIRINFDETLGDLDMALFNSSGTQIDASTGFTGVETISLDGRPAGEYSVRVFGFGGDTNPTYSLNIVPPIGGGGATDDSFEDNDVRGGASDLGTIAGSKAVDDLIMNDAADWFEFTTTATGVAASNVQIFFQNSQGDLDMRLYDGGGNEIDSSTGTGASEEVSLSGRPAGTYFVEVFGFNGATNPNYALTVNAPTGTVVSGDHVLYLSTEGYDISRAELVGYAGNQWLNVANDFDADANGISVQPFLQGRADREQVITAMIGHMQADLAPFGIEVRRINGGAVTGDRATTLFMGASTLTNNYVHVAPVDIGNNHLTDIAFVGNEDWGSAADTALALADVAIHEAGHTFGLLHVVSGNDAETMGLRYNTPQSQWLTDTGFLDTTYNVRPGDGTGTQNSFEVMSRLFGLGGNPAPNPVGGLGTPGSGVAPNVAFGGEPCVCGLCGSLSMRGVALEQGVSLAPTSGPVCGPANRGGAEAGESSTAVPRVRTGIGFGGRLHPAPIRGEGFGRVDFRGEGHRDADAGGADDSDPLTVTRVHGRRRS